MIYPDFFIGGAQKCGTTSLAFWLDQHPMLVCSKPKEPNFFSNKMLSELQGDYSKFYRSDPPPGGLRFEATTSTMVDGVASQRICETVGPHTKFIFVLRDPVKRAISAYWHMFKHYAEKRDLDDVFKNVPTDPSAVLDFEDNGVRQGIDDGLINLKRYRSKYDNGIWAFRYLYNSLYSQHIAAFQSRFGTDNVLVLALDQIKSDPRRSFDTICAFLDVPPFEALPEVKDAHNPTVVPVYLFASYVRHNETAHNILKYAHKKFGRGPLRTLFVTVPRELSAEARQRMATLFESEYAYLADLRI